jgi:hypothetical protein
MGRRIDSPGQSGNNLEAIAAYAECELPGDLSSRRGGVACAHNGNRWPRQACCISQHREDRRRIVNRRQSFGVVRFANCDHASANRIERCDLVFGLSQSCDPDSPLPASSARQVRRSVDCVGGIAEMVDKPQESRWPDILASEQAQPVPGFGVG